MREPGGGLRLLQWRATHVSHHRTADFPDSAILEHARINCRVVVTYDADYASLHWRGVPHAGIAYFPKAPMDGGVVVRTLELLDDVYDLDDFENWLEYL